MKGERYSVSLRIWHPSADPSDLTAALGIEPDRCWRSGDARTTSKGRILEGFRENTYWVARVLESAPESYLADALQALVGQFSRHKGFFRKVRSEGGKVEFFVGWYIERNIGDEFDISLLAGLADLGVNLSLDIYPGFEAT